MENTWFLVVLILVNLFASISIIGALNRIRNASEKALVLLEEQSARQGAGKTSQ
ncbi:MAG: hypothetical protein ACRDT3_01585 [Glutamicibacter sp.]